MRKIILSVAACFMFAFSFFLISNASAALWTVEATYVGPVGPDSWTDFTVVFNDELKFGDPDFIDSFTGVTGPWFNPNSRKWMTSLYTEISDVPYQFGYGSIPEEDDSWAFFKVERTSGPVDYDIWSYEVTPVPVPATVWLLGSGLVGLVAFRRKQKG